jgi:hypothetical protein
MNEIPESGQAAPNPSQDKAGWVKVEPLWLKTQSVA